MDSDSESLTIEVVRLKDVERLSWNEIAAALGIRREKARSRYRRYKGKCGPPTAKTVGVCAQEPIDEEKVFQSACREWERTEHLQKRKKSQLIEFSHGPVAMVWQADLHLGGPGVDYPRLFDETELIAETPGMFANLAGDIVDSFIIERLRFARQQNHHHLSRCFLLVLKRMSLPTLLRFPRQS